MNKEIEEIIETVPLFNNEEISNSSLRTKWIGVHDFYRAIDDLTKWNKVEDELPIGVTGLDCLCLKPTGKIDVCNFFGLNDDFIKAYFFKKKFIEWRYVY